MLTTGNQSGLGNSPDNHADCGVDPFQEVTCSLAPSSPTFWKKRMMGSQAKCPFLQPLSGIHLPVGKSALPPIPQAHHRLETTGLKAVSPCLHWASLGLLMNLADLPTVHT
jgi:hypothetical protein